MPRGFCGNCRAHRDIDYAKLVILDTKGGQRRAVKGRCSNCGRPMQKWASTDEIKEMEGVE